MTGETGQATIEWTAAVLVVALTLGAAVAVVPAVDGRSLGGLLAHRILCAARGGCDDGDDELAAAYGERDAELVRRYAPGLVYEPGTYTLPVDFRECRSHHCSDAPDERGLDVQRSTRTGTRASAFTHVVRRGDETFLQYWLYYPDSPSTFMGSHAVLKHLPGGDPANHLDDWESYQVRVDARGAARVRASSHRGYQGCKERRCKNTWTGWTGWSRVSKGSHAGHIPLRREPVGPRRMAPRRRLRGDQRYREVPLLPGRDLNERTTTAAGLRLVPIESVDRASYRRLDAGISPPWDKEVFREPLSNSTS